MSATIKVTYDEFKKLGGELVSKLATASADSIRNGVKCFNLAYLGLSDQDAKKARDFGVFDYVNRKAGEREIQLEIQKPEKP